MFDKCHPPAGVGAQAAHTQLLESYANQMLQSFRFGDEYDYGM